MVTGKVGVMEILASRVLLRLVDHQRSLGSPPRRPAWLSPGNTLAAPCSTPASHRSSSPTRAPPLGSPPFPGALWLQVRDVVSPRPNFESRASPSPAPHDRGVCMRCTSSRSRRGGPDLRAGARGSSAAPRHQGGRTPASGQPSRGQPRRRPGASLFGRLLLGDVRRMASWICSTVTGLSPCSSIGACGFCTTSSSESVRVSSASTG